MIVLDASACVDLVLATSRAAGVADAVAGHSLHAPDLLDLEVTSALARLERGGWSPAQVTTALGSFRTLPVRRHSSRRVIEEAWSLRLGLRLSDAYYVAVARRLGTPLLTTDGRLSRGAPGDVEVVLAG